MIKYPYITAHYPTWEWYCGEIPGMKGAPAWYEYLLAGLRGLCKVEIDPAQDALSASREHEQWTSIRFRGTGLDYTAVYDWCDFDHSHRNSVICDGYWKIMTRNDHAGIRPIGQTLSLASTLRHLSDLRRLTTEPSRYDVICLGRATAFDLRVQAVRILRRHPHWRQLTGVSEYPRRPPVPADVEMPRMDRTSYLRALAQSRVCVALPGVGGDWTWRHTEALAIGVPVVCPSGPYVLPGEWRGAVSQCKRDLSDLGAVVHRLLSDETERKALAKRGLAYYEAHLSPRAMASAILTEAIKCR